MTTTRSALHTPVCDLLGITHPVLLGGMASATSPELVAAVSNAGGMGILGATGRPDIPQIAGAIRSLTKTPFGMNLLLFFEDTQALDTMLAVRPAVASFAWPWPHQPLKEIFARAHDAGCKVMHMVSQAPEAVRAAEAGADVIVAQGSEGGGHVGVMATLPLVPMVVDAVAPLPVLAAGGIADGRGLAAAIALGAQGALIGTRFLATNESPLPPWAKQVILDSDGHDSELTELPDLINQRVWPGAFARVWRNEIVREFAGREWQVRQRAREIAARVNEARSKGDAQQVPLYVGQDAGLIHSIEPAGSVLTAIVEQATAILGRR